MKLSLEPDEHMRWIYDARHPDYHSDYAKSLRERRANALNQCPQWMFWDAWENDERRKIVPNAEVRGCPISKLEQGE